jgi:CRP/FNR family transcriptional regulator, anaerobic regulatory protein
MRMPKTKPYCTDDNWPGRPDCKHCVIRSSVLFAVLTDAEIEEALLAVQNGWLEPGFELFAQGGREGYLYAIRAGCVKMVHAVGEGASRIVRLHWRGEVVGLEALLNEPYRHSAVVLQKADVCRIPVSLVHTLAARNPELSYQIMRQGQVSLDAVESAITDLNSGSGETRLAQLLLKFDAHSGGQCIPDLLREDIASIIGVTTETASRLMADFRRRKLLWSEENKQLRCDAEALKKLV